MCLTSPGHVLSVDPQGVALVDVEGSHRAVSTLLQPDVVAGDWVVIAGGAVLCRVDPDRARAMTDALATATAPAPSS